MSLRVAAIALVGYDLDYLDTILNEWIAEVEGHGPEVDFALDLLDKIAVPKREDLAATNGKAA
jgi:hypothetical protein